MVPKSANPEDFFVHQPKSMNSETFTLPQGAPEVVGTCKLDTHGFNTNDLQKINFYVEHFIFPIRSWTKHKIFFFKKNSKFENLKKSKFQNFQKCEIFEKFKIRKIIFLNFDKCFENFEMWVYYFVCFLPLPQEIRALVIECMQIVLIWLCSWFTSEC